MSVEWLFSAIVITALAIIVIVVIFGGILCVQDETYTFSEYLHDLSSMWPILTSALLGTTGRAMLPLISRIASK